MKRRLVAFVIALLASHAIVSCGSRHVVERPDTTRPAVVSTTPLDNATGVVVTTAVTVAFSETMDASSINDVSFSVTSATTGTVAGTVTYDAVSNVATFMPSSAMTHDTAYTANIAADAKDLAGNSLAAAFNWSFTTIPAPGALDRTFGTGGRVRTALGSRDDIAFAAAVQQDGKIVTAGYSSVLATFGTSTVPTEINFFTIARFQTNGALDTTFGLQQNGRADYFVGTARSVAMQPDGKIIAAGGTDATPSSFSDFRIARYNTDGTLDTGFVSNGTSTTNMGYEHAVINSLAIQQDGKIVVAGDGINSGPVIFASLIARYDADGTLDTSFNAGGKIITTIGTTSRAVVVKIQPDGKIVVGGNFQDVAGPQSIYLARYDSNGVLDPLFSSGIVTASTGTDSVIADIEVLSDGKLLVVGTTNIGADDLFLMRFNPDGAIDSSFGSGGTVITDDDNHGVETASDLSVQTDGRIIVAATFRPVSGLILTGDIALFRYNADGTLDTTFGNGHGMVTTDFGSGGNDAASNVQIQTDGKIVVVGSAWNGSNSDIGLARYWP